MKYLFPILALLAFACLGIIAFGYLESRNLNRVQLKEIQGLKKQIEIERDSLKRVYELRGDSLEIAFSTIRYLNQNTSKDTKTVTTKTESHEKIIFVNLNDSTRHSKLAKFYPSYKHP